MEQTVVYLLCPLGGALLIAAAGYSYKVRDTLTGTIYLMAGLTSWGITLYEVLS